MIGLFKFNPGAYSNSKVSGSYIRLVLAGGTRESGPFFPNPSSKATTYTLLAPGTDGGLRTGSYQPAPTPAFNATGDAQAARIITPQRFAFIQYSAQTSPVDPQTGANVPAPAISVTPDGKLSGQLQAFAAQWNKQNFNVGSPKPDGSSPGLTSPVTGTYNPTRRPTRSSGRARSSAERSTTSRPPGTSRGRSSRAAPREPARRRKALNSINNV